jgi:hypothetical protein
MGPKAGQDRQRRAEWMLTFVSMTTARDDEIPCK